jgi:hypothetical protein
VAVILLAMNTTRQPRLGIDIGRVIIDGPSHPGGDTAFFSGDEATMLATPEMAGCVPAVARLAELLGRRVWLVSKCGPRVQARTLRWLDARDFWARAGVPREHIRFCRERREKRAHCEELGLTHFVDDHPEVHAAIRGAVQYQYFFGPQRRPVPPYGIHAATWAEALRLIEASLAGSRAPGASSALPPATHGKTYRSAAAVQQRPPPVRRASSPCPGRRPRRRTASA